VAVSTISHVHPLVLSAANGAPSVLLEKFAPNFRPVRGVQQPPVPLSDVTAWAVARWYA
jgi:hypothetical protein